MKDVASFVGLFCDGTMSEQMGSGIVTVGPYLPQALMCVMADMMLSNCIDDEALRPQRDKAIRTIRNLREHGLLRTPK